MSFSAREGTFTGNPGTPKASLSAPTNIRGPTEPEGQRTITPLDSIPATARPVACRNIASASPGPLVGSCGARRPAVHRWRELTEDSATCGTPTGGTRG